jgi:hypothetical protein
MAIGLKEISSRCRQIGIPTATVSALRVWAARPRDPMPLQKFCGRYVMGQEHEPIVMAWGARQWKGR